MPVRGRGPGFPEAGSEPLDVAVIGGGPAGAAAAMTMAREGLRVGVLDRAGRHLPKVGETLPPRSAAVLQGLGVWERFRTDDHLPSYGNRSAWGTPQVQEYDFIFDVHGRGWHLDRGRFDSMLVDTAVAAGALWSADTRVLGSARSAEGWRLDLHTRGRAWSTSARVVVDASGRPATFARARTPRAHHDHLVGLSLRFAADPEGLPGNVTLVESVPEGWWYSAPLPGGQAIVVFMTDADLVPRPAASRPTELRRLLTAAPCTDARLRGCVPDGTVRVVAAGSATLARAAGDRWLAVGDAAAAYDPLSSQGIITALETGQRGGRAVGEWLSGDCGALSRHADLVGQEYRRYLAERAAYYRTERRWPSAPFWRRRAVDHPPAPQRIEARRPAQ